MGEDTGKIEIHRGLKGVYFDRSKVCFIDGRAGELLYRGYTIHDLSARSTFEETCHLLLHGELPPRAALEQVDAELKAARVLPAAAYDIIRARRSRPMSPTTGERPHSPRRSVSLPRRRRSSPRTSVSATDASRSLPIRRCRTRPTSSTC